MTEADAGSRKRWSGQVTRESRALDRRQRRVLEQAKDELRKLYGRD